MGRTILVIAVAMTCSLSDGSAQSPTIGLSPGRQVKVRDVSGRTWRGGLVGVRQDSVVLTSARGGPISLAEVDSLWVRHSKAESGAVWGARVMGVLYLFVGIGLCESGSGCVGDVIMVAAMGAGMGAGLGVLFGSMVYGWDLWYAAPKPTLGISQSSQRGLGLQFAIPFP